MIEGMTITKEIHFQQGRGTRKVLKEGPPEERAPLPAARTPRLARLMALALRLERLVKDGEVADYADIAELGHVTRARVTQIMNLLCLAPDIQEAILFLPGIENGRDPIAERMVRPIAAVPDWRKQRTMWTALLNEG